MAFVPLNGWKDWWDELPNERRFSASVLGICGILVVVLSFAFFRSHLSSPFLVSKNVLDTAKSFYDKQAQEANADQASRDRDTDRDGLSDWSELNTYHTSPYLSDSDSDGVIDSIEIAQGTDPNCPLGQQCSQLVNAEPGGASSSTFANLLDVQQVNPSSTGSGVSSFILSAPDPSSVSPSQIRQILKQNGLVAEKDLIGLSDTDVVSLYNKTYAEVLKIRQAAANQGVTIPATTSTAP